MKLTCATVRAHPAVQTHLSPRRLTAIVSKVVVSRDAQLIALVAVVVFVAADPDAVDEASHGPVVHDVLPGVARVDHSSADAAFDQQLLLV